MAETKTTAITSFEPQSLGEAMTLAEKLAASSLMPQALQRNASNVLVQIMAGRERGIGIMQSISSFHVINGKAVMSGELIAALVMRRPECEYLQLIESTDRVATYETKRRGAPAPVRMSYTIDQAKRAGLIANGNNYAKNPEDMLRWRATTKLCRVVYPDLLLGICEESEAEEIRARDRAEQVERAAAAVRGESVGQVVEAEVVREQSSTQAAGATFDPMPLTERIFAAKSVEELRAMRAELAAAPESEKPALRAAYNTRSAELVKPVAAGVAVPASQQVVDAEVVESAEVQG